MGIEGDYQLVYEMDCDFSHKPKDLVRLRQACIDGADVAVGSRYVKGGAVSNWPIRSCSYELLCIRICEQHTVARRPR